jgi:hypothetical protein
MTLVYQTLNSVPNPRTLVVACTPSMTGANSKRQPELATFSERPLGSVSHPPLSSRLQMSEERDRLALACNTFLSDLRSFVVMPAD